MAKYRVTVAGKEIIINGPEGAKQEEIEAKAKELYRPKAQPFNKEEIDYENLGWDDVAAKAVFNLAPSTARMVGDIWDAVSNPIDTATTLTQVIGGGVRQALNQIPGVDVSNPENEKKFDAVVDYFADKYGTTGGFKKALAEDPASILADISAVFTAGGTAAAKTLGTASKVGQIAEGVATQAAKLDPLTALATTTVKGTQLAGKGVTKGLAFTAGVGEDAIKQAYKAGKEGGEALDNFTTNLRNADTQSAVQILNDAQENLQALKQKRRDAYNEGMGKVSADKQRLPFDDIDAGLDRIRDRWKTDTGIVRNESVKAVYDDMLNKIDEFKKIGANRLADFDDIKQSLNSMWSKHSNSPEAIAAISEMTKTISNQIKKVSPEYAKTMKAYEDASDLLYQIQHSLSLGKKKPAEVSLKKLLSTMRNNVSTNYGQRYSLAEQLQDVGGKNIMSSLAGQELSSVMPKGLRGVTTAGGLGVLGMGGMLSAGAIPTLIASSPRFAGEAALAAGRTARMTRGMLSKLPVSKAQMLPPASGSYAAVLGRDYEEEE
jgi:hypothetical protein